MNPAIANICSFAGQLIPLSIGLLILFRYTHLLGKLAGMLTLKPLFTTPLWAGITASDNSLLNVLLAVLPDAGLTILLVYLCRSIMFAPEMNKVARVLVVLDCLRWIFNPVVYLVTLLPLGEPFGQAAMHILVVTGGVSLLFYPAIFSLIALFLVNRNQPAPKTEPG
jgi:hypothetical protein